MKKLLAILLALAMVLSFAACGGSSGGKQEGKDGEIDTSKEVELVMYFISDRPAGQDIVDENMNKIFKEKLNCTLKINWISWAGYADQYNLKLTSGENIDLIYTAGWLHFSDLAQRGAFKELDDLWPKYAPNNYKKATEEAKMQATVKGHIYCVPTLMATYMGYGPTYRTDILKGTELEGKEVKTFEDVEKYCEVALQVHPEILPLNIYNNGSEWDDMWMRNKGYFYVDRSSGLWFDPTEENPKIITLYEEPSIKEFLEMMSRWNEKGFFSKSCLSDTDSQKLQNGKAMITVHNIDTYSGRQSASNNGQDDYSWDFYDFNKYAAHLPWTQDSMAIPASSKNPERALALWDLITTDQEAFDAFYYGIEGKTYELNDKGEVHMLDPDNYGQSGFWAARTTGIYRDGVGTPQTWHDWHNKWEEEIKKDNTWEKYTGFVLNSEGLETEVSNVGNVMTQYWMPLELGLNNNGIDGGLEEYKKNMEAAGIEKLREEYQKQLDEYVKSIKK